VVSGNCSRIQQIPSNVNTTTSDTYVDTSTSSATTIDPNNDSIQGISTSVIATTSANTIDTETDSLQNVSTNVTPTTSVSTIDTETDSMQETPANVTTASTTTDTDSDPGTTNADKSRIDPETDYYLRSAIRSLNKTEVSIPMYETFIYRDTLKYLGIFGLVLNSP
jgi:hypothetical protein